MAKHEEVADAIELLTEAGYKIEPPKRVIGRNKVSYFGRHNHCSTINVWQFSTSEHIPAEKYKQLEKEIEIILNKKPKRNGKI